MKYGVGCAVLHETDIRYISSKSVQNVTKIGRNMQKIS